MPMLDDYFKDKKSGVLDSPNVDFEIGSKVSGRIIAIDSKSVFVDINAKSEGIINREEVLDAEGNISVEVGDIVEAYFVSEKNGEIMLTNKMTGKFVAKHMEDAYYSKIPVEGKVIEEKKGGYLVKVAGKDAFCPYSQVDMYPKEPASYIGNSYSFVITQMTKFDTVVSRRKLLEESRKNRLSKLKETLKNGDTIDGTVEKIMDFGVFVSLDGCEGFIPISELAWGRIQNPAEIVTVGDRLTLAVKNLDWENNKITLSYRSVQTSWDDLEVKYPAGTILKAKITRLAAYGAFAELEKGLEGLIHISKLEPGRRINHPKDVVSEGEIVSVVVEGVDKETKRISLARDFSGESSVSDAQEGQVSNEPVGKGKEYNGIIDGIKPFGLFIRLSALERGLLHISELKKAHGGTELSLKMLDKKYPVGSKLPVMVKDISEDGKISLVLAGKNENMEELDWKEFSSTKKSDGSSFGTSMADAFGDLKF
ncbi:MAG: S1 RNA-binding domain-containing protein [Lentisphaerota bacterium]